MSKKLTIDDLSEEQIALINNGVGSMYFQYKPAPGIFEWAAKWHDVRYYIGGNEWDRIKADLFFLRDCVRVCLHEQKYFDIMRAVVYYISLIPLGIVSFEYGRRATAWAEIQRRLDMDKEFLEEN